MKMIAVVLMEIIAVVLQVFLQVTAVTMNFSVLGTTVSFGLLRSTIPAIHGDAVCITIFQMLTVTTTLSCMALVFVVSGIDFY